MYEETLFYSHQSDFPQVFYVLSIFKTTCPRISRYGLLLRKTASGLSLYYDRTIEQHAQLPNAHQTGRFSIRRDFGSVLCFLFLNTKAPVVNPGTFTDLRRLAGKAILDCQKRSFGLLTYLPAEHNYENVMFV